MKSLLTQEETKQRSIHPSRQLPAGEEQMMKQREGEGEDPDVLETGDDVEDPDVLETGDDVEDPDALDAEDEVEIPDTRKTQESDDQTLAAKIPDRLDGARMDVILYTLFERKSRSWWQNLMEKGLVLCDGQVITKAGRKGKAGQTIRVTLPEPVEVEILPEEIPLDILYEDNDLIVVNKPKGMVVHPAPGHSSGTLVNALMYHCRESLSGINGVLRPGIVHRIDRDTTGSLVAAKNDTAHESLARQFKEHSITRAYRAIVHGNLTQDTITVDAPVGRHPKDRKKMAVLQEGQGTSRRAVTHIRVLERFGQYTFVECVLETGRTHQIRVHMAHIGHPVLGDRVYGPGRCPFRLEGQTLHAMTLGFIHPKTGRSLEFTAPLPEYFEQLLTKLRQ